MARPTSILDPEKMGRANRLKDRPALRPEDLVDIDGNPVFGSNPLKELKGTGYTLDKDGNIINTSGYLANAPGLKSALRRVRGPANVARQRDAAALFG